MQIRDEVEWEGKWKQQSQGELADTRHIYYRDKCVASAAMKEKASSFIVI